jgi:hypothetical protein
MRRLSLLLVLAGCTGPVAEDAADPGALEAASRGRGIAETHLAIDLTTMAATATLAFDSGSDPNARLELSRALSAKVRNVTGQATIDGDAVVLSGLPAGGAQIAVDYSIAHSPAYAVHDVPQYNEYDAGTYLWPDRCGALFPCHSLPADGTSFTLSITGVPEGMTAVYPSTLAEAPSYQIAWAVGRYRYVSFGTTAAGTEVGFHVLRDYEDAFLAARGEVLRKAFDFAERTYGAYRFGPRVASVEVSTLPGFSGGQEHHPYWHVDTLSDDQTNVHESIHGWFGDGIRVACWEDLALSEGVTTYVTARTLMAIGALSEADAWDSIAGPATSMRHSGVPAWPQGCTGGTRGSFDEDGQPHYEVYMRGAQFMREVARQVGVDKLDTVLAAFYRDHGGKAAHMADLLDSIRSGTGFDPRPLAQTWLRAGTTPEATP